jgi:hypothetical protein
MLVAVAVGGVRGGAYGMQRVFAVPCATELYAYSQLQLAFRFAIKERLQHSQRLRARGGRSLPMVVAGTGQEVVHSHAQQGLIHRRSTPCSHHQLHQV